jgi:hypothetical protein
VPLQPAGDHCKYATELQAFHYGFHRGFKRQYDIRDRVSVAWHAHGRDRVRGMALTGFLLAVGHHKSDYNDSEFKQLYNNAQQYYDQHMSKVY